MNCTTATFRPCPMQRSAMPSAAVVLPLPAPAYTISTPFSSWAASMRRFTEAFSRCMRALCSAGSAIALRSPLLRVVLNPDPDIDGPSRCAGVQNLFVLLIEQILHTGVGLHASRHVIGGGECPDIKGAKALLIQEIVEPGADITNGESGHQRFDGLVAQEGAPLVHRPPLETVVGGQVPRQGVGVLRLQVQVLREGLIAQKRHVGTGFPALRDRGADIARTGQE